MLTIRRFLILTAIFMLFAVSIQAERTDDLIDGNTSLNTGHWWGQGIRPPLTTATKTFTTTTNTEINFSSYNGVSGWVVDSGVLKFTLTSSTATLGWGNYQNNQDLADVVDMWEERNDIIVRIKGSTTNSKTLTSRLYANGSIITTIAQRTGSWSTSSWTEVRLDQQNGSSFPTADGFELKVAGTVGESFEIEWVKLEQKRTDGYVRNEFTLPAGTIWRAIAEVGGAPEIYWYGDERVQARLYINGEEIDRNGATYLYHANSVDITPYLQTGANCIGLYGYRVSSTSVPSLYFQCRIIMADGTELEWDTDTTNWKATNTTPGPDWCDVGYSEAGWVTAAAGYPIAHYERGSSMQVAIAAYGGPLDIRNPDTDKINLFYEEGLDTAFDVYVPEGLKTPSPNPVLKYYIRKPVDSGTNIATLGTLEASGQITTFAEVDNSLKYTINLGNTLPDGVYTISLELTRSGVVFKSRAREPFVIITNHAPTKIVGTSFSEGMTRTLEETISFNNPNDPHSWKEYSIASDGSSSEVTTPKYVTMSDGSKYREVTGSERSSFFTYRFVPDYPGDFYMAELDYPDDKDRLIECSISHKVENEWDNSICGVGAETGRTFFKSYKMKTLNWVFRATTAGFHSVDIVNGEDGLRSAAAALRIYHISGDLPAVQMGSERSFGIQSERTMRDSGIGNNFGIHQDLMPLTEPLMRCYISDLIWMKETFDHYTQYLKFAGQNMHIMGAYQYSQEATPALIINHDKDSRLPYCYRAFLANVLDINDIDFYLNMEFCHFKGEAEALSTNAQVAQGRDTAWMVSSSGGQSGGVDVTRNSNWLHPDVQAKWLDYMTAWAKQYKQFSHFKGVHNEAGTGGSTSPWFPAVIAGGSTTTDYSQTLSYSFDDYTFELFATDTGIDIGVSPVSTSRFNERKLALNTNPEWKAAFYQWRADKYKVFMEDTIGALRAERSDLGFLNDIFIEDNNFFEYWLDSGKEYKDIMTECAFDFDQLHTVPGLWTGRWTIAFKESWRWSLQYSQSPYLWLAKLDPRIIDAYDSETNRYVFVRASWDENHCASAGYDVDVVNPVLVSGSNWIMESYRTRIEPQPAGFQCREPIIDALISADPELLVFGWTDLAINLGNEQKLRNFTKVYSQLPPEKFSPVFNTGFDTNLAIRKLVKGTDTWVYVANPAYWPISGSLTLDENSTVTDLSTGSAVALAPNDGKYVLSMELEPFGLVGYKISSNTVKLISYDSGGIPFAELEHLQGILGNAQTIMGLSGTISALSSTELAELNAKVVAAEIAILQGEYAKAMKLLNELPVILDLNGVDWKGLGYYSQTEPNSTTITQNSYGWAPDADVDPTALSWQPEVAALIFNVGESQVLAIQLLRDGTESGGDYILQYQEDYDTDTPGLWADVEAGASWEPESSQEVNLSNNAEVLTGWYSLTPPSGGYGIASGEFSNDGVVTDFYAVDKYLEVWYSIKPAASAESHNYRFRLIKSGSDISYLSYPKATYDFAARQSNCAWADDDSVSADAISWQGEGTELQGLVNKTYLLAVQVSMIKSESGDWVLQYQEDYDTGTPGAWTDVTDSGVWRTTDAQALSLDNNDVVQSSWYSISAPAANSPADGEFSNDNDGINGSYLGGDYVELWYALQARAPAFGHTYRFRVIKASSEIHYPVYATAEISALAPYSFQEGFNSYTGTMDINLKRTPAVYYTGILSRLELGQFYDPADPSNGEYNAVLIHFSEPNGIEAMLADLPSSAAVTDAKLRLYATPPVTGEQNRVLEVSAVTDPNSDGMWSENAVNTDASYRNYGLPWSVSHSPETLVPLQPGDAGDHGPEISNVTIGNYTPAFYELDVTDIVQGWIEGDDCQGFHLNIGLNHPDGSNMWKVEFVSQEGGSGYPDQHPKLTVEFDPMNNPTAEAGADRKVAVARDTILDGSDSAVADGKTITSYQWTWTIGVDDYDITSAQPTATTTFVEGVHEITLTVEDSEGRSHSDTMTVTSVVQIPGDTDLNGVVNLTDFVLLRNAFGSTPGVPLPPWNPNADFDNSGEVNLTDFVILRNSF